MPAKDIANGELDVEAAPAAEPAPPEQQNQSFQTEGQIPTHEKGGATPATATASQLAFEGDKKPKGDKSLINHGVHQPEEYKHLCDVANRPDKWKESYRAGHTKSEAWSSSSKTPNTFTLKKGHSASASLREWFKGPTIASWHAIAVAEQLAELQDELGDQKFDKLFGSAVGDEDRNVSSANRLHINPEMYTTPFIDQMKAVAREADDKENKPEAEEPKAMTPPGEEKQPRPEKQDTQQAEQEQEADVMQQRDLGFQNEDLQRM